MKGRKIEVIGVSFRGMYMRNIADIMPNRSYLRSNADIPKLSAIRLRMNIFQIKLRDEYDRSSVQPI